MSAFDPQDPLTALWKSAPPPDPHRLIRDLERWRGLHRRLNFTVLAVLWGVAALLLVGSHWGLSVVWVSTLLVGTFLRRRVQCSGFDALSLDTPGLLRRMIVSAKRDLFVARCLCAGVPCGALVGYALTPAPMGARLHWEAGLGSAALVIMIAAGAILARSRRAQVRDLSGKLARISEEL